MRLSAPVLILVFALLCLGGVGRNAVAIEVGSAVTFTIQVKCTCNTLFDIAGASVWFDGSYVGTTLENGTITIRTTYPPSDHNYRITASGYLERSGVITIGSDSGGFFVATLEPQPQISWEEQSTRGFRENAPWILTIILVGVVVIFVISSLDPLSVARRPIKAKPDGVNSCIKCGTILPRGAKFCDNCGTSQDR